MINYEQARADNKRVARQAHHIAMRTRLSLRARNDDDDRASLLRRSLARLAVINFVNYRRYFVRELAACYCSADATTTSASACESIRSRTTQQQQQIRHNNKQIEWPVYSL